MSLHKSLGLLILAAPLVACGGGTDTADQPPADAAAPSATGATGTSSITGRVSYGGEAPEPEVIKMSADPKCAELHPDGLERAPFQVGAEGGVAGVVVHVKGITGGYPAPSEPGLLDQQGCTYQPRAVVLMTGQELTIRNSDPTLHNIHPRPKMNDEFNVGQPREGMTTTRTFSQPELLIPVGCDVHPWMRAYISVFDHPFFAVTAEDGTYTISNLPAGDYEVEALHPTLDAVSGSVTVAEGETASLDLAYGGAAAEGEGEAEAEGE